MNRRSVIAGSLTALTFSDGTARAASPFRGLWQDRTGAFGVGAFPEFGQGLFAFDYVQNRIGPISLSTDGDWTIAAALNGAAGTIGSLRPQGPDLIMGDRRLAPVNIRRQPFRVASAGLSISAELASPHAALARASVLLVYGSGPATKAAFDPWALWFLSQDMNVITHDKRGSGQSDGDWRLAGLEDLAADAQAVLSGARSLGIKGPVFAWGASQGGWILPQLAAKGLVDGLLLHAGAATTPGRQILDQVIFTLKHYGFDQAEIDRASAYYALDVEVSQGRRPWSDIDEAYRKATAAGAEWILEPPKPSDAPERTMIRLMANFDPAPYWRKCKVPVLALYGAKDWIVPAETNRPRLEQILKGRPGLETQVIPDANHLMFLSKTGELAEYPKLSKLSPDYFVAIKEWLSRHAGTAPSPVPK